ncbi:MAG: hypothetical protein WDN69_32585 [Aliidongia sp.]
MSVFADLPAEDLADRLHRARIDYEAFRARALKLDMTRGKPSPEQLDLSIGMLTPARQR